MKNKTTTIVTLAIVAVLGLSALSYAGPRYRSADGTYCPQFNALTPEKQAAAQEILNQHRASMRDLRTKIWAKRTTLDALVASGKADKAEIESLVAEMSDIRNRIYAERTATAAEIEKATGVRMFQAMNCSYDGNRYGMRHHRGMHRGGNYGHRMGMQNAPCYYNN